MTERLSAIVGARISEFQRKMAQVKKTAMALPNKVVIEVEARVDKTQRRLDRLANTLRTIQTISGSMAVGSLMAVSPASIPVLGGLVASLAMLGPMMGAVAGSSFALASALGVAGAGVAAFGATAATHLSPLFGASSELKKLNEELAQTKDAEKRAEILEEISRVQNGLNKEQLGALGALRDMQKTWSNTMASLQTPVLEIFIQSMESLEKIITRLKPTFENATFAFQTLMERFSLYLDSDHAQRFFKFLETNVYPMTTKLGQAFGNFGKGLMSMMMAFEPLMHSTAQGFLDMSKRFAGWADNLKNSKSFQNFIRYVEENMPKVRAIFRDALAGITYFFAAWGPLSSDMMTGLADLMARFKEWAKTLQDNPAFQNLIAYIRENGPTMLEFINQLTTFITNLIVGMAPLGAKILEIVTNFLTWMNSMMETHPWLKKVFGYILVGIGILKMLIPPIILAISWFSGIGSAISKLIPWLKKTWTALGDKLKPAISRISTVIQRVIPWVLRIGSTILRFATGPIGLAVQAVIALGIIIYKNWDKIKKWTSDLVGKAKAYFSDMKNKVTSTVIRLVSTAKRRFNDLKDGITSRIDNAKDAVKRGIDRIKGFFDINLFKSGKAMISSVKDGIVSAKDSAIRKAQEVAQKIRNLWPFSPAKEGPLRDIHRMDFKGPITDSINRGKSAIQKAMQNMISLPEVRVDSFFNQTIQPNLAGMNQSIQADLGDLDIPEREEIIVELDGKKVGKGVYKHVNENIEKEKYRRERT